MLKVLVADDEPLARETVKLLLDTRSDIAEVAEAHDGKHALDVVREFQPDVAILDIEMPGISGIELAKRLPPTCKVVFATAYDEFAVEAFELCAVDYILKPFDDERFFEAFNKAIVRKNGSETDFSQVNELIRQLLQEQTSCYRERLVIRDPGRIRLIDVDDIEYITGAGNYAEIHLSDGKHVLHRETLSALEEQLDPQAFVRIHRSSIVRRSCVSELRPNDKGDYSVILSNGATLTLSRRNRAKLEELTH